jgi:hypothetical protein
LTESAAPYPVVLLHVQQIVHSHGKKTYGIHDRWGTFSTNGDQSATNQQNVSKNIFFTLSKCIFLIYLVRNRLLQSQLQSVTFKSEVGAAQHVQEHNLHQTDQQI